MFVIPGLFMIRFMVTIRNPRQVIVSHRLGFYGLSYRVAVVKPLKINMPNRL